MNENGIKFLEIDKGIGGFEFKSGVTRFLGLVYTGLVKKLSRLNVTIAVQHVTKRERERERG